jgi:orotate phosphoribosyltransferase
MSSVTQRLQEAGVYVAQKTILKNGETSDYYIDVKKAYGNPEILGHIATNIVHKLHEKTSCIAASGHGGLPLGAAVSLQSGLPFTIVRDTEKKHGLTKQIDGYEPDSVDVITIVDDVFTAGTSLRSTISVLQEDTKAVIHEAVVIVNRGDERSSPIPLSWLIRASGLA